MSNTLKVKVKRIHKDSILPKYAKDGDAAVDLTVTSVIEKSWFKIRYGFGIAMEFDNQYYKKFIIKKNSQL